MPWTVAWLDPDLRIYDTTISSPFTKQDEAAFYAAWFDFVGGASAPLYALFDVANWDKGSDFSRLLDRRFAKMGRYRDKIRVIAMVSHHDRFAQTVARIGARMLGRPAWFQFFDDREEAIAFLREQASAGINEQR